MDRIGTCLSADAEPLTQDERLEAVKRSLEFAEDPAAFLREYDELQERVPSGSDDSCMGDGRRPF